MAETELPVLRWTQLIAQSVHAVFAQQKYWWVIGAYALVTALPEAVMALFLHDQGGTTKILVLGFSLLIGAIAFVLFDCCLLSILFSAPEKFDRLRYVQNLRKMMKPYTLSVLAVAGASLPVLLIGGLLLYGMGMTLSGNYLQTYPLMLIMTTLAVIYGLGMRLSFSYIDAMDDGTGALKVAWRRAQPYWWDMAVAALVFVIPETIFKFWWSFFAPQYFSSTLSHVINGCVAGIVAMIVVAIQITAYRFAKAQNLKSGNENGAAA